MGYDDHARIGMGGCHMNELIETRLERREVFSGKLLHVFADTVSLPNGKTSVREVIEHQGAVCMVPLRRDGTVVLVRQYRYAVGRDILEVPAGKVDPGESFYDAAERELSEETGLQASQWIDLGDYLPSPGYSGEVIRAYLAMDLDEGEPHTDEDEFLVPVTIPVSQALDLVMSGAISDGKTAFALLKAARYLGL